MAVLLLGRRRRFCLWALASSVPGSSAKPWGADPPPASDQFYVVFTGVVALWFAVALLVRAGYLPKLAQFAVLRINASVIAILVLGGAIQAFAVQEFVGGTVNLIVALLAFVVARSELPASPRSGGPPTPSGKPGRPNPTHERRHADGNARHRSHRRA